MVTINNVLGFIVVLLVWYKIQIDMIRTEQNFHWCKIHIQNKGLLPKQHIKYKTKKQLNTIKLHIHV